MKESAQTLHTSHRDKNRHWHVLMLLLPSMAFVLVLALFVRNRYIKTDIQVEATPLPQVSLSTMTVKDTTISVRLAKTESEQRQGLSGVQSLEPNEGMLFVFSTKQQPPFWMKDMLIPLDFIWIKDGKVVQLNKNIPAPAFGTPDNKLSLIVPNDTIDHVLEVNAGFIDSHKIAVGDSVTIP